MKGRRGQGGGAGDGGGGLEWSGAQEVRASSGENFFLGSLFFGSSMRWTRSRRSPVLQKRFVACPSSQSSVLISGSPRSKHGHLGAARNGANTP